jgi:hypothetical protein
MHPRVEMRVDPLVVVKVSPGAKDAAWIFDTPRVEAVYGIL